MVGRNSASRERALARLPGLGLGRRVRTRRQFRRHDVPLAGAFQQDRDAVARAASRQGGAHVVGRPHGAAFDVHQQIANLLRQLPPSAESELARLGLAGALRHVVEGELDGSFDSVRWDVADDASRAARSLPAINSEVLFFAAREAIRNAARYGRGDTPSRPLHLTVTMRCEAASAGDSLVLMIDDDGVGLDHELAPAGGSGQGLALHGAMMALLGGTLAAEQRPDGGVRVALALPVTVESVAVA